MTRILEIAKTNYSNVLKQVHEAGIEAVSEPHWSTLKSTAELILNPKFAVFQVHQQITQLKQQLPDKSAEFNAAPYREVIHWARLIQPHYRKKQAKTIECLNDPLWWHRCVETVKTLPVVQQEPAMAVLNQVQNRWHFQQAYAHYSTLDILHVYQTTLPVFTQWLHYAKIEWQQKAETLSPRLKAFYQNYLIWFEQVLLEEKAIIRNCLRERLAIGLKKGYGAWDDVIESLREELEGVGVLPKSPQKNSCLYGYLTPEIFVRINQIIEQEGSESEKVALHQLAYYPSFDNKPLFDQHRSKTLNHFHHQWLSRNDAMTLKSTLYSYLPRFLQRLFWDEEVRTQFFQHPDYQFLLAQENAFLNADLDVSTVSIETILSHPAWQQSQMCLPLIFSDAQRILQWLQYPLAFFFPEIVDQLQNYQQSLKQNADSWMNKQLTLLECVMADKKTIDISPENRSTLQSAFVHLETLQKQWLFSPHIKNQFVELEQRYQALCQDESPTQTIASLPQDSTVNIKPLYEIFRDTLLDAIASFELTQNRPNSTVEELKTQLKATFSCHDDKLCMRICLLDYLKNCPDLPRQLNCHLQKIVDQPEFTPSALSESVINQALSFNTTTQGLQANALASSQATSPLFDCQYSALDEDPWDYSCDQFARHCDTIKTYSTYVNVDIACWNQKLCQYVLTLLKHTHALEHWDDFVLHQQKVGQLLTALIQANHTTLQTLHQALEKMARKVPTLTAETWNLLKKVDVEIQIKTLEKFMKRTANASEAASYMSQKELSFVRPPRGAIKADISPSPSPQLLPNPTL